MLKKKNNQNRNIEIQNKTVRLDKAKNLVYAGIGLFVILSGLFYWFAFYKMPTPYALKENRSPQTTIIRDRKERVLYKIYKNANRTSLDSGEIPDTVKNATIAIEDSSFYHHPGISVKSIFRAILHNLKEDNSNFFQGGSTITQQLVKNKLLTAQKSYRRKIREIILALWTERIYSKEEILTMYLNEVSYGGPDYGIEAAAETYFNKHAQNLTLAESSFLAGLPVAPTTYSIFGTNPTLAKKRQLQVLTKMLKLAMITKEQFEMAKEENLVFARQKIDIQAPHFVMYVKNQLVNALGEAETTQGGLDVVTTLDLDIQEIAEEIVKRQINDIQKTYNIHNAATLITDPKSGEILAMVGSVDYFDAGNKGFVNVTTSLRQPGSAIKPVNYSYAFDHGYNPASVIEDSPVSYTSPGAATFKPENYDGKFHGNVTLRSALANSYNIPAIKVLKSYGVDNMLEMGKKMGIRSWDHPAPIGLSLTLGGLEVTMTDMARVYGTIANSGVRKELKSVVTIKDYQNQDLTSRFYQIEKIHSFIDQAQASEEDNPQVISPISAYWLTDILSDNSARMAAFGTYSKLSVPNHKVAVKTGTSNNFRDNWTIGFTPDYLVAVWVGNNDGSYMNNNLVSGVTGAAPIWNEIMTNLLTNSVPKEFTKPEGMIAVNTCAVNGLLTCPNCPEEKIEYFIPDKVPTQKCFFRPSKECEDANRQSEGKSNEERKILLAGCPFQ